MKLPSRKACIRIAAWLLALCLVAAVTLNFLVRSTWFIQKVRLSLERGLGRRVTFSAIRPSLWLGVGAKVDDFTIYEEDGSVPFLKSENISLKVRLLPLLWKSVSVKSVALYRPRLALVRDDSGEWNFERLVKKEKPPPAKPGIAPPKKKKREKPRFSISLLRIKEGFVTAEDPSWSRQLVVKDLNLRATDISPGALPYIDGIGSLDDIPVGDLLAGVKEFEGLNVKGGLLAGTVELKGWMGKEFRYRTELAVRDARVSYGNFYAAPESGLTLLVDAEGDGSISNKVWNIQKVRARCFGGRLEVRGKVRGLGGEGKAEINVSARALPWAEIGSVTVPNLSLGGAVSFNGSIVGGRDEMVIDAELDLSDSAVSFGKLLEKRAGHRATVKFPSRLSGNSLRWEGARLRLGELELQSEGSLGMGGERPLAVRVKGEGLDCAGIDDLLKSNIETKGIADIDLRMEQSLDRPVSAAAFSGVAKVRRGEVRLPALAKPVAYEAVLSSEGGAVRLGLDTVRLGASLAEGHIDLGLRGEPVVECDLHCPVIDTADFAAPPPAVKRAGISFMGGPASVAEAAETAAPGGRVRTGPLLSPFIRRLKGTGRVTIGALKLGKLRSKNGRVRFKIAGGKAEAEEIFLPLYGGSCVGDFTADMSGAIPRYTLASRIKDVDIAGLLSDLYGYGDAMTGKLFSECVAEGEGLGWTELKRKIVARGRFSVRDGSLRTFGLLRETGPLFVLLGSQAKAKELVAFGNLLEKAPAESRLSRCEGDFILEGERWGSGNLLVEIADKANPLRLQCRGTMGLDGSLNLIGHASFPRGSPSYNELAAYFPDEGGWIGVPFPIPIGGTLAEPRLNREAAQGSIAKCAAEIAKLRLKKELEKKIDKALEPPPKKAGEPQGMDDMGRELLKGASKELLKKVLETR